MSSSEVAGQVSRIQRYYEFQSKIYDLTRWAFLFGRREIIRRLPFAPTQRFTLLEVGCGTGYNLSRAAAAFPEARLIGLDVSAQMLQLAGRRFAGNSQVSLVEAPYGPGQWEWSGQLDAVLFSYSLTMINPQWESLLHQALADLKPGGVVAVADFYDSRRPWFKNHMANHHVRMDAHLRPVLEQLFETEYVQVHQAYFGVWMYFLYVGRKPQ